MNKLLDNYKYFRDGKLSYSLLEKFFEDNGPFFSHFNSFDQLVYDRIEKIVGKFKNFLNVEDNGYIHEVKMLNCKVIKPHFENSNGEFEPLLPYIARARNLSYECHVFVDILYTITNNNKLIRSEFCKNIEIFRFPCMVRSSMCWLNYQNNPFNYLMNEDFLDQGGYFIINGNEKTIVSQKIEIHNKLTIYKATKPNEIYFIEYRSEHKNKLRTSSTFKCILLKKKINSKKLLNSLQEVEKYKNIFHSFTNKETMKTNTMKNSKNNVFIQIMIKLPHLSKKDFIPLFILFRYYGVKKKDEAINLIINPKKDSHQMIDFVKELFELDHDGITPKNAFDYIKNIYLRNNPKFKSNIDIATKKLLNSEVFPHISIEDTPKAAFEKRIFLAYIVRQTMLTYFGKRKVESRGNLEIKQLKMGGNMLSYAISKELSRCFKLYQKELGTSILNNNYTYIYSYFENKLTQKLNQMMATGNWNFNQMKSTTNTMVGISQTRLQYQQLIAYESEMRKINVSTNSKNKNTEVKQLQGSHWGYICAVETSEGQTSGLRTSMANTCVVRYKNTDECYIFYYMDKFYRDNKMDFIWIGEYYELFQKEKDELANIENFFKSLSFKKNLIKKINNPKDIRSKLKKSSIFNEDFVIVFVDGKLQAIISKKSANDFFQYMRNHKKKMKIPYDTSIFWNVKLNFINIHTLTGTFTRPVLCLDKLDVLIEKYLDLQTNELKYGTYWYDLLKDEIIEYMSPDENLSDPFCIASTFEEIIQEIQNDGVCSFTHVEINEDVIKGICASSIVFDKFNQASRLLFFTSMNKQSKTYEPVNAKYRHDVTTSALYHAEKPLVETNVDKILMHESKPCGTNPIVAIMSYGGYNGDDSLVMKKEYKERGFGKYDQIRTVQDVEKLVASDITVFGKPHDGLVQNINVNGHSHLDDDGLPDINLKIKKGQSIVGMFMKNTNELKKILLNNISNNLEKEYQNLLKKGEYDKIKLAKNNIYDESLILHKSDDYAYVKNVMISKNENGDKIVKCKHSVPRNFEIGDKKCLTWDHKVLCKTGTKYFWKFINKVKVGDEILSFNFKKKLNVFKKVRNIYSYNNPSKFSMFEIQNRFFHQIVTPEHKLPIKIKNKITKEETFCLMSALNIIKILKNYSHLKIQHLKYNSVEEIKYIKKKNAIKSKYYNFFYLIKNMDTILYFDKMKKLIHFYIDENVFQLELDTFSFKFLKEIFNIHYKNKSFSNLIYQFYNQKLKYRLILKFLLEKYFNIRKTLSLHKVKQKQKHLIIQFLENEQFLFSIKNNIIHFYKRDYFVDLKFEHFNYLPNHSENVYCLNIKEPHIFLVNYNGIKSWTGNSSRHGQKGIVGFDDAQINMPFCPVTGTSPDLVMNLMGFPTRMTPGQIIETLYGIHSALTCELHSGSIKENDPKDIHTITKELKRFGFRSDGKRKLIDGRTGKYIECEILMGPCYYNILKHHVLDKYRARAEGPNQILTRQPVEGRCNNGGIRFGEMEKDGLISHGATHCLKDRLCDSSDPFYIEVFEEKDEETGETFYVYGNDRKNKDQKSMDIQIPYGSHIVLSEMRAMNIGLKLKVKDEQ